MSLGNLLNFLFSEEFIKVLGFSSIFLSILILVLQLFPDEKQVAAKRRLGVLDDSARPNRIALFRWFRPLYSAIVPVLYSAFLPLSLVNYFDQQRKRLHLKLVSANIRDEISPDEFLGFKFVMSVFLALIIIYLTGALGSPIPGILWPVVFVGGYFFADLWLQERIKIRRRAIIQALPYTLDLLTLSVEAGLDFIASIQRLTQRSKTNALLTEFGHLLKEVRLGTSRADSLRNLSDRLQIEEISSFTTLLIQADQLGASIGQVLRAQSDQLRSKRFQAAETAGARASQLVLFPMVLCIFPAIFIVVLGPTVLNFLQRGFF